MIFVFSYLTSIFIVSMPSFHIINEFDSGLKIVQISDLDNLVFVNDPLALTNYLQVIFSGILVLAWIIIPYKLISYYSSKKIKKISDV